MYPLSILHLFVLQLFFYFLNLFFILKKMNMHNLYSYFVGVYLASFLGMQYWVTGRYSIFWGYLIIHAHLPYIFLHADDLFFGSQN